MTFARPITLRSTALFATKQALLSAARWYLVLGAVWCPWRAGKR